MTDSSSLLSVRLPDDIRSRLDQAAKATRRSRGSIVKDALSRHLDAMSKEDREAERQRVIEKIMSFRGAGVRLYGGRSAEEIDADINAFRGGE